MNEGLKNLTYLSDTFIEERKVYEDVDFDPEKHKGVLRIVEGPLAEYGILNRNKRMYSESLWDIVLESPYVKEQLSYHTLYGECNHPQDRYEVDFERVSHSIVRLWKVPATNQIYGRIYILDTPFGRILNTLYEAGGIIGYSSRAGGTLHQRKVYIDVDEKTYNFITFDAVPYPSVVSARPGVITEGKLEKVQLSEEVHNKICKIILESGMSNRETLKDFIYSIDGYDMSRERKLFESDMSDKKVENEQEIKETTLSLLKESSSQIDSLKADNMSLKTKNSSLVAENENLKARLNESLDQLTKLGIQSKKQESEINESTSSYNDTISKLESKISELRSVIEDKDLELSELLGIKEAFKVLESENAGMKSVISESRDTSDSLQSHSTQVEAELKEAYLEISSMVQESVEKDSIIESLNESLSNLKSELRDKKEKIKSLSEDVKCLKSDKSKLVDESKKADIHTYSIIENLKSENSRLNEELEHLNESIGAMNVKYREDSKYADSLIEVISGSYGISASSVKSRLSENFTKDDVYRVCESFSNSVINGVSYDNIAESVIAEKHDGLGPDVSKIASIFSGTGNRRGLGLI